MRALPSFTCLALLAIATVAIPHHAQSIDPATGLIQADGWETVQSTCTECHSAQLITQNAGSRAVWKSRIVWMQENQGLRELQSTEEDIILSYLAEQYGPKEASRRAGLPVHLMPENPYPVDE